MKRIDTSKITFWGFAFLLLIFVEAAFFHNGNIVFVLLGAGLIYYGTRKRSKWTIYTRVYFSSQWHFSLYGVYVCSFSPSSSIFL